MKKRESDYKLSRIKDLRKGYTQKDLKLSKSMEMETASSELFLCHCMVLRNTMR